MKNCVMYDTNNYVQMSDFIMQYATAQTDFTEGSWIILSGIEASIKKKIEAVGLPLKAWGISIYRGVLTGYNEAFIINEETRARLIKASPKSDEIIRPILLGKNIKRYKCQWGNLWIINSHNGIKAKDIARIDIEADYPFILDYLKTFLPKIKNRSDQGDNWTNLRNCAYADEFEKPKIVWGNLSLGNQFTFVKEPMIINNPSNFIATDNLYLLAVLNSKLADFYIKQLGVTRNGGYFEYKPMFVEKLPIPQIDCSQQNFFSELVKNILYGDLTDKEKLSIENKINYMVYKLYDLTESEIIALKTFQDKTN